MAKKKAAGKPARGVAATVKKVAKTVAKAATRNSQKAARAARPASSKSEPPATRESTKAGKYVYLFGKKTDGNGGMKPLLGGKGANLAEMCRIGLPVPPGFTITTEVCTYYYDNKRTYPAALKAQMQAGIAAIEQQTGKKFGDLRNPLLVSVRSGARDSMPGMMDTILNLGLNDQTVEALATKTGNARFAWDCYRRFIQMYGDVVLGVQKRPDEDHEPFETVIHELKHDRHHEDIEDTKLSIEDLQELVRRFKALVKARVGKDFPTSPWDQLMGAVGAVFGSWMNDRAIVYRRKYNIPTEWGTAVNVQAMVYGNTGERSGSGVAFTRNPANGVKEFYGEFLINAQGEDVVAGVRTPEPVSELKKQMPHAYAELERIRQTLEKHFKDVQDFEFTIEDDTVYMLQTRNGKRTAMAALKFSIDMFKEKLIDWKTAVQRNPADQLEQLLAPVFDAAEVAKVQPIATGLPAGPGAASGQIYLNAERAVAAAEKGEQVLLVRVETSPEDLRGMIAAEGILTARGGVSSHAALVARQMGKVCVCGAAAIEVDYQARKVTVRSQTFKEGDWMSIDGTAGNVYAGRVKTAPSEIVAGLIHGDEAARKTEKFRNFQQLMKWCSDATRMSVRTNADTPEQTANAIAFGAVGIGLCRTEHMFFEGDRIDAMREMILAETVERAEGGARQIAAVSARRLRRHLPRPEGLSGDDSFSGSAAARVPAPYAGSAEGPRQEDGRPGRADPPARRGPARIQPDARFPRLPSWHRLSRDLRDAGAGGVRSGGAGTEGRNQGAAGDHDPAGRFPEGARSAARGRAQGRPRRPGRAEGQAELHGGDDDRGAARRVDRRRDRAVCRVLQFRHQRPDADRSGHVPRRLGFLPAALRGARNRQEEPVCDHRRERRRAAR